MEESIDRLMRACGLRNFAYRRYPPIQIASPGPATAMPKAIGTVEADTKFEEEVVAPLPPEDPPVAPDLSPAREAAAAGRTTLPAAVRLRRPKRPVTARAEFIQEPGDRAEPSPATQRVVPVAAQAPLQEPPAQSPVTAAPTRPRAAPRPPLPRAEDEPSPIPQAPAAIPPSAGAPARRFALLDEVSAEATGPRTGPGPGRSTSGPTQDPPGPGRPRPRPRLHIRNGGAN